MNRELVNGQRVLEGEYLAAIIEALESVLGDVSKRRHDRAAGREDELVDVVGCLRGLRAGRRGDPRLLAFGASLYELLERWRDDPGYADIRTSLANPDRPELFHTMSVLITAEHLRRAGNDVHLVRARKNVRSPDIVVLLSAGGEPMGVEVKVPGTLINPTKALSPDLCTKIVRSALTKAGIEPGGQLGPERPGILVLGAFGLCEADRSLLTTAAGAELRLPAYGHICGFSVMTCVHVDYGDGGRTVDQAYFSDPVEIPARPVGVHTGPSDREALKLTTIDERRTEPGGHEFIHRPSQARGRPPA
jgi:hypothetical protein